MKTWKNGKQKMLKRKTIKMSKFTTEDAKNQIIHELRRGIMNVVFTKADGSERKLICTLSEDNIPADKKPKGNGTVKSDVVLPVFDMENNSWRSFRWDSVQKVDFLG